MLAFARRTAFFLAAVVALQLLIHALTPPARRGASCPEKDLLDGLRVKQTDIIYFGDSVLRNWAADDVSHDGIDMMLQAGLPGASVGTVQHGAYHAELYRECCRYMIARGGLPRVVIVPINLRSFSPSWECRPAWRFDREQAILRLSANRVPAAFYKPLLLFKVLGVGSVTEEDFEKAPVFNGREQVGLMQDFEGAAALPENATARGRALSFYMGNLDRDNRRLRALADIARWLQKAHVRPLFYVTPVDHQFCAGLLGDSFYRRISDNVAVIQGVLAAEGADVLNLSLALGSADFNHGGCPHEHLRERGRRFVADQVRARLE